MVFVCGLFVCVCVYHSFYMVGSCVAIFMWICLGEENRHNIEDETPVKCAYGIIYFDSNVLLIFRLKVLPNIFIFLCVCSVLCFTFSRYVFFLSLVKLVLFLWHSMLFICKYCCVTSHKWFRCTCEKFFCLYWSLEFPIGDNHRLSGQLQNKIFRHNISCKLCCFGTLLKPHTQRRKVFDGSIGNVWRNIFLTFQFPTLRCA